MSGKKPSVDATEVAKRIIIVRGQRVLLDSDLAELYGVPTRRLNEQVRRNQSRFPPDFMFRLRINEVKMNRSQFATGSAKHRDLRFAPFAVEMTVYVVRAFVKLRELLTSNAELAQKLEARYPVTPDWLYG